MNAGDIVELEANAGRMGNLRFSARVLFWWEVQSAREMSVVSSDVSSKRFFDRSKFMKMMIDELLVSIDEDGRTMTKDDLGGRRWGQCIHPLAVKPIYDTYIATCHSSSQSLLEFGEKVAMYFDGSVDENQGIYVAPPELFEVLLLERCGGLTLSEIRKLSYVQMRKYMIVLEHIGAPVTMRSSSTSDDSWPSGISSGVPMSVLSDPRLTANEAERLSKIAPFDSSVQGQFGRLPEW